MTGSFSSWFDPLTFPINHDYSQCMARKRMIDPTIWEDESFGLLDPLAKVLFIGLFSNADDEGIIRANDSYIRSTIFMYDDISLTDVRQAVDRVVTTMRSVCLYEIDGNRYIKLLNWENYQKQREDRVQKSALPQPNQENVVHVTDKCQTDDGQMSAQVKLSKVKLSKVKLSKVKREGVEQSVTKVTAPTLEKYRSLNDLTENDFKEIAEHYQIPLSFVLSEFEDMRLWAEQRPNNPKLNNRNWRSTLMAWVKKDAFKIRQQAAGDPSKRGIDARGVK